MVSISPAGVKRLTPCSFHNELSIFRFPELFTDSKHDQSLLKEIGQVKQTITEKVTSLLLQAAVEILLFKFLNTKMEVYASCNLNVMLSLKTLYACFAAIFGGKCPWHPASTEGFIFLFVRRVSTCETDEREMVSRPSFLVLLVIL